VIRLADLTPEAVAAEVVDAVLGHLARYAVPLSPGVELHVGPARGDTGLGVTVADLTRYAQTGDTADWGDDDGSLDAAQQIHEALYGCPADRLARPDGREPAVYADPEDPTTAIGVVLRAAEGRRRIAAAGGTVPRRWLAALAGVPASTLKTQIARGRLAALEGARAGRAGRDERQIAAEEALRWLAARVLGADGAAALERAGAGWRYECGPTGRQPVAVLQDRSGHGRDAVQPDPAARPTLVGVGAAWLRVTGGVAVAALATERGWAREGGAWVARPPA
jgi:hypothetical protein